MTQPSTSTQSVYVALDFETANQNAASACALAMVRLQDNQIIDEFYSLIKPPDSYFSFSWLHGITWQAVQNAPSFSQLWPSLAEFMQPASFLLAHNAAFDRRVLQACCGQALVPAPAQPFLCTLKGARRALPLPSHRLDAVCRHLGIALQHHQAQADARAAAQVFLHLRQLGLDDQHMLLGRRPQP